MRLIFIVIFTVLGVGVGGCRCSPASPTAVTIRVKNASRDPIYVNDTDRKLGVTVQREVNGALYSFNEHPCACQTCDQACSNGCDDCGDAGISFIQRVEPGSSSERTWDGVVQVSGFACSQACLAPENAPLDETFTAHLCYTNQVTGFASPDGGRAEAPFPNVGVVCVDKRFKPADGVVEIGPERGSDCATNSDCRGVDELCFNGSCTTGCPANTYPSSPGLRVASITNRGFFTVAPIGAVSVAAGTGLVTSAQYNGTTLTVQLSRKGSANETLTGSVQVTMPTGDGPALTIGANVLVTVFDASTDENQNNRALTIRDATTSQLLFAADVAQLKRVLGPTEVAPFTITDLTVPTGCRTDACGKALFVAAHVVTSSETVDVETGDVVSVKAGTSTYRFVNAFNASYAKTTCDYAVFRPYAVWITQ